jgi:hypothetical protein
MSHHHDDERPLEQMGEEALVEAIRGGRSEVNGKEALAELARRGSPRASGVLSAVLVDDALPADVRAVAAVEAGKQVAPAIEPALVAALRSRSPLVVRRAAESLGRIGGRQALQALRATRAYEEEPAVARAVSFARTLISYRLGLGSDLFEPPDAAEFLAVDDTDPVEVKAEPVPAGAVEGIAPRYRLEVPGIAVSLPGALHVRCGTNEFLLMPQQALADLARSNAVAGVVMKSAQSLGYFALHLYLLSHRKDEGTLALFGVRPDGTLTHVGEMHLGDREHTFRVSALNTPYGAPIDIEGRIELATHRIVLTRALVNRRRSRSQRRAQVPTRTEIRS